jgi:oligoendopeptidase F
MKALPEKATDMMEWTWSEYAVHYDELARRELTGTTVEQYLADWTRLHDRVDEVGARLSVAKDANTADKDAEARFNRYIENVYPRMQEAEQKLKARLLGSGLKPAGFELPLRKMQAEAAIYRDANLPLSVEQQKLNTEYSKIVGSQTVQWEGREVTVTQLRPVYFETNRERREAAWRLASQRQLADRKAINELWQRYLKLRLQLAGNAGFGDYRSYRWQELLRFDYTPENSKQFQQAIETAVVPAATRIYERRRKQLGLKTLRPWDLDVDPRGRAALAPFKTIEQFKSGVHAMLTRVDTGLGGYFRTMIDEKLFDLDNRKNKAPGGYCTSFEAAHRPFIFMNAVGLHGDVMTLVHEAGHACHSFAASRLPYYQQRQVGLEFAEVASMGMELLASPYFGRNSGGFYSEDEAARAYADNLERDILFWPYMALVDAFQHWVYENPADAMEPANCDRKWAALWNRFMPGVDWSGFEDELATGWHRKLHIHQAPLYYVEYGLAQLGACQVWANALKDQSGAVTAYKGALALGGMKSLPELFSAAGARFAFDADTLRTVVSLMEEKLGAEQ